jgi:hypothetical protein
MFPHIVFHFLISDLDRVSKATGALTQTTVFGITADCLGTCETFEEKGLGDEVRCRMLMLE